MKEVLVPFNCLCLGWRFPPLHHSALQPFYPKGSFNVSVSVISYLVWFIIWIDANSLKPCTLCLFGFYESYLAMLLTWCFTSCLISQKGKRSLFQAELTHYHFSWNVWHTELLQSDRSAVCCEICEYRWTYLVLFYTCKFLYSNLCTTMFARFWHSEGF